MNKAHITTKKEQSTLFVAITLYYVFLDVICSVIDHCISKYVPVFQFKKNKTHTHYSGQSELSSCCERQWYKRKLLCPWKQASYLELKLKTFWKEKDHQTTRPKITQLQKMNNHNLRNFATGGSRSEAYAVWGYLALKGLARFLSPYVSLCPSPDRGCYANFNRMLHFYWQVDWNDITGWIKKRFNH